MSDVKLVLGLAIGLRIFFSSFFYHPDIRLHHFHAQFLKKGVVNIYKFVEENRGKLANSDRFNYPPVMYYFWGGWQMLVSAISGGGLHSWINDWGGRDTHTTGLFYYLLLLKFPYLIADILLAALLVNMVGDVTQKRRLVYLWAFNPVSLYCIYVLGQFDIVPALFTVLSLYFVYKSKHFLAIMALVGGSLVKTYPLLLVPFVLLKLRSAKDVCLAGLLFVLTWLPLQLIFIFSPGYIESVINSGLTNKILSVISLGDGVAISPFLVFYFVVLLYCYAFRNKGHEVVWEFFAVMLGVIITATFHAQWLVWSLPFALLVGSKNNTYVVLLGIIYSLAFGAIFLINDKYMTVGLLTGINPYLAIVPSLPDILKPVGDALLKVKLVVHSGLLAFGVGAVSYFRKYDK